MYCCFNYKLILIQSYSSDVFFEPIEVYDISIFFLKKKNAIIKKNTILISGGGFFRLISAADLYEGRR